MPGLAYRPRQQPRLCSARPVNCMGWLSSPRQLYEGRLCPVRGPSQLYGGWLDAYSTVLYALRYPRARARGPFQSGPFSSRVDGESSIFDQMHI